MKRIAAIAWKDTLVRFSSRTEILFFLILPGFFTFLIGGGLSRFGASEDRIPVLMVDADGSGLAANLKSALDKSESLQVQLISPAEAQVQFEAGQAAALLTVPAGFEAALRAGSPVELHLRKAPDDPDAEIAEQAVLTAASSLNRALAAASSSLAEAEQRQPFARPEERATYFADGAQLAQSLLDAAPARSRLTRPPAANVDENDEAAGHASAGQLVTWVFIPLLGTSALFAYERTQGTLRRVLTTPTPNATLILGTIVGQLGQAIVQMVLLLGFGAFVMGVSWGKSPLGLAAVLLSFACASVAFGTMLGTWVKTEGQAASISMMAGMAMALLGGCWYPAELFPEFALMAAQALPTRWAMQGLTDLAIRGHGLIDVLPSVAALGAFAAVFFTVGVWRFRFE